MAAIDFPNSPANNDLFTDAGTTWKYASATGTWTVVRQGPLAPAAANAGQVLMGDASNVVTATTISGDASLSSSGVLTMNYPYTYYAGSSSNSYPIATEGDVAGLTFTTKEAGDFLVTVNLDLEIANTLDSYLSIFLNVNGTNNGIPMTVTALAADMIRRLPISRTWLVSAAASQTIKVRAKTNTGSDFCIFNSYSTIVGTQVGD